MQVSHIDNHWLPRLIGVKAIVIYPWVLYRGDITIKLFTHESIHVEQIRKIGIIPYYISYGYYYLKNRIKGMPHYQSYLSIPYEVEAFSGETKDDTIIHDINILI